MLNVETIRRNVETILETESNVDHGVNHIKFNKNESHGVTEAMILHRIEIARLNKQELREVLEEDVNRWVADGNTIRELPAGVERGFSRGYGRQYSNVTTKMRTGRVNQYASGTLLAAIASYKKALEDAKKSNE